MSAAEQLDRHLNSASADTVFSEAVLTLEDGTRLCFCHTVEQRWAKAVGPEEDRSSGGMASELVAQISSFRLTAKPLDIQITAGSRIDPPVSVPIEP